MDDTRRLRDILLDQCEAKEIKIEELAKRTGMPEQYLDAIVSDVRRRLPAFPYIRPHLAKVAVLLGLPPELLIEKYRKEFSEKASGGSDMLPGNRFALPSGKKRYAMLSIFGSIIVLAFIIGHSGFFGEPHITIDMPPSGKDPFVTSSGTILLAGKVDAGDSVTINGEPVATDAQGAFSRSYQLMPEINIIEFSSKRFLGRSLTISRQIYYEEATSTEAQRLNKKRNLSSELEPASTSVEQ